MIKNIHFLGFCWLVYAGLRTLGHKDEGRPHPCRAAASWTAVLQKESEILACIICQLSKLVMHDLCLIATF